MASVTGTTHDTGDLHDQATIQVIASGVAAAWTVELDGSLDGVNWIQLPLLAIAAGVQAAASPTLGGSTLGAFAAVAQTPFLWRWIRAKSGANTTVTVAVICGFQKT